MEKKETKRYTRAEKLKYYATRVAYFEHMLKRAQERLDYISSDEYQEWDSELAKELEQKKAAK